MLSITLSPAKKRSKIVFTDTNKKMLALLSLVKQQKESVVMRLTLKKSFTGDKPEEHVFTLHIRKKGKNKKAFFIKDSYIKIALLTSIHSEQYNQTLIGLDCPKTIIILREKFWHTDL